jgi:hypothetical protein
MIASSQVHDASCSPDSILAEDILTTCLTTIDNFEVVAFKLSSDNLLSKNVITLMDRNFLPKS